MPPPRGISCDLCGQKFFKHSLPIHRKKCEQKFALCYTECTKCLRRVSNDEYEKHMSECTVVRKRLPPKKSRKQAKEAPSLASKGDQVQCSHCKKGMASESLKSHIQVCAVALANPNADCESSDESSSDEESAFQTCGFCSRRFSPDRIAKHEHICSVNANRKKRKVFKSAAEMRLEGTEFEKYKSKRREVEKAPSRWRQEHAKLEGMVEQGRLIAEFQRDNIPLSELPPNGTNLQEYLARLTGTSVGGTESAGTTKSVPDGYEQCPHCQRNFNAEVAARHIPKCKTTVNKPKRLQRKSVSVLHQAKTDYHDKVITVLQRVIESKSVKNSYYQTKEASMFKEDDLVTLKDGRNGSVKYIGRVDCLHPGYWIGVQLSSATGLNDGSLQGHRYFKCGHNFGVFIRPSNLSKVIPPVVMESKKEEEEQQQQKEPEKRADGVAKPARLKELGAPVPETSSPRELRLDMKQQKKEKKHAKPTEVSKKSNPNNTGTVKKNKPASMVTKLRNEVKMNSPRVKAPKPAQKPSAENLSKHSNQATDAGKQKRIAKDVAFLEQLHGTMSKGERGFGGKQDVGQGNRLGKPKKAGSATKQNLSKNKEVDATREARAAYFERMFGSK